MDDPGPSKSNEDLKDKKDKPNSDEDPPVLRRPRPKNSRRSIDPGDSIRKALFDIYEDSEAKRKSQIAELSSPVTTPKVIEEPPKSPEIKVTSPFSVNQQKRPDVDNNPVSFNQREEENLTFVHYRFLIHFPIIMFLLLLAWVGFLIDLTIGYPTLKLAQFFKKKMEETDDDRKKTQLLQMAELLNKIYTITTIFGIGGKNSALMTISFWQDIWMARDKTRWPPIMVSKTVEALTSSTKNPIATTSEGAMMLDKQQELAQKVNLRRSQPRLSTSPVAGPSGVRSDKAPSSQGLLRKSSESLESLSKKKSE